MLGVLNAWLDVVQPHLERSFASVEKTEAECLVTWDPSCLNRHTSNRPCDVMDRGP
jgi:hypothetical protein